VTPNFADSLELFFGDANPAETRVYARVPHADSSERLQLGGHLTGPFCQFAQTLPATIPLVDVGPGPSLLAQAVVPDPCFWTPELPFLYRARVELRRDGELLDAVERPLGIRPLGSRGRRFYYEGRPWVLRGVHQGSVRIDDLCEYREAAAALFVDDPDEALCAAASEQGVLIVASLRGDLASLPQAIQRLARHAAVGFIVPDEGTVLSTQYSVLSTQPPLNPRTLAPNVVFVQRLDRSGNQPAPWAGALLCSDIEHVPESSLPLIAYRAENESRSIPQRRASCDALQRDLAGSQQIAGYLV
jgi:hypothetical protein